MKTEKQVTIFLLALLVTASVATFFIVTKDKDSPDEYVYNDFRVFKSPTVGYTIVAFVGEQPYHLQLRNDPKNVTDIPIDSRIRNFILLKEGIIFTLDPNFNSIPVLGATEMANVFGRRLGIYDKKVTGAVTREPTNSTTPSGNLIANCKDVTTNTNVIKLQLGDTTEVYLEKNGCIIVQGTDEWEIIRASDRLIYDVLEVIEN
ncbi:MAG: hypothetical protein CMH64_04015 [Nanoarchaeota archaeon]|nr:hypothetical protein [Nanoarchaeota archaeon]